MLVLPARLSLLLFCLPLSVSAHTTNSDSTSSRLVTIPAFSAKYTLLHKGDPVGSAVRELKYLQNNQDNTTKKTTTTTPGDNLQASYHYHTNLEWLIFSDKRSETSRVTLHNNQVTPMHYVYEREGTGRDKSYEWRYDIANKSASDLKKERTISLDVTQGLQDKLSYHLQHRLNLINNPEQKRFSYPVISTSGSIKDYVYQYDGEEELMLPYGLVKTIRLKREVIEKKRVTYAWFAPELNYLLVKLYQVKAGAEQFEAQLASVSTQ